MRTVVFGATGRAGGPIVEELHRRDHQVRGVARHPQNLPESVEAVGDDMSDLATIVETITGFDVVVSAYAPPPEHTELLPEVTSRLIKAVQEAGRRRLVVVGGCGSLWFSPGVTVLASGHWPEKFVPIARAHIKALEALRASDIDWTYLSPPMQITPGQRTGQFRVGTDDLITNDDGASHISFEDYAVALVDELEQPRHRRSRFTVGY